MPTNDDFADQITGLAYLTTLADHAQPDCRCKVELGYEPATPENGAIRDCYSIKTDPRDCSIEQHMYPFGKPPPPPPLPEAPIFSEAHRERRERWREALGQFAEEIGGRRPEPWQLDVAAHLLSLQPKWEITAKGQIWSQSQRCASEVATEMQADGRIDAWGNWPEGDRE